MDADIQGLKKEMAEIKELMTENTRMMRLVYRQARFSTVFSIVKWVLIIGISVGSLYFIQPYLENLMSAYSTVNNFGNAVGQNESLLNQLKDVYLPR